MYLFYNFLRCNAFDKANIAITQKQNYLLQKAVEIRSFFKSSGLLLMASKQMGLTPAVAEKLAWAGLTFTEYLSWAKNADYDSLKKKLNDCGISNSSQIELI